MRTSKMKCGLWDKKGFIPTYLKTNMLRDDRLNFIICSKNYYVFSFLTFETCSELITRVTSEYFTCGLAVKGGNLNRISVSAKKNRTSLEEKAFVSVMQ